MMLKMTMKKNIMMMMLMTLLIVAAMTVSVLAATVMRACAGPKLLMIGRNPCNESYD